MIDADFMHKHFTLAHVTDKPVPQVDPEQIEWILEAMVSAAARLRGTRCELSDKRAATALACAAAELREQLKGIL